MTGDRLDTKPRKLRVIACGMLAREVLAVKQQLGLDHLDLKCLPAEFHFHPDRIPAAMDAAIAEGRFGGLLNFLRRRIHHCGRVWSAGQLIERITGQALSSEPFMNHLRAKLLPIFAL